MRLLGKYNCIFCKYKKLNKQHDYACMNSWEKDESGYPIGKCNSLSNIYYGKIVELFPFKQIDYWRTERAYKKEEKHNEAMDKKYGDCRIETDDWKFIWGITNCGNLFGHEANMCTMNDIDIIYDKQKKEYILGVETAYTFETYNSACSYLRMCLDAFSKYMDDNELDKNKRYDLFMGNPCTSMVANSIEDLYTNFKIFVNGFCSESITENEKMENNNV